VLKTESLVVFPNPTANVLHLNIGLPETTSATARVVDLTGRTVKTLRLNLTAGEQQITLPVNGLPVGTYLLRLDAASGYSAVSRFTVAR